MVRWNLQRDFPLYVPSFNIAPSQQVPVIVNTDSTDTADKSAAHDFPHFLRQVASVYSHGILKRLFDDPSR